MKQRDDNLVRSIVYKNGGWITVKKDGKDIATSFKHYAIKTHRNSYGRTQVSIIYDEDGIAEVEFGKFKSIEKCKDCNGYYLHVGD